MSMQSFVLGGGDGVRRAVLVAILSEVIVFGAAKASSFDDFNKGISAFDHGDDKLTVDALSAALASKDLLPSLRPAALVDRGVAYTHEKRYAEAIVDFTEAIGLKPDYFSAIQYRTRAYVASGDIASANRDCYTLIALRAQVQDVSAWCGCLQWQTRDFKAAIPYFQNAVRLAGSTTVGALDELWLEIARLRAGEPDETAFAQWAENQGPVGWPAPIVDLYLGKTTPKVIDEQLKSGPAGGIPSSKACNAAFFVGEWYLLHRQDLAAKTHLRTAASVCPEWTVERESANADLKQLEEGGK
jgi:lipoprotein NlpI